MYCSSIQLLKINVLYANQQEEEIPFFLVFFILYDIGTSLLQYHPLDSIFRSCCTSIYSAPLSRVCLPACPNYLPCPRQPGWDVSPAEIMEQNLGWARHDKTWSLWVFLGKGFEQEWLSTKFFATSEEYCHTRPILEFQHFNQIFLKFYT